MMGNKKNAAVNHHYAKTAKRLMGYVAGTTDSSLSVCW